MADTFTPNIGLTKPEIGASDDTWGDKLNANADLIDLSFQTVLPLAGGTVTGVITVKRAGVDMLRLHNTNYNATDYGAVRSNSDGSVSIVSAQPAVSQYMFDNAAGTPATANHVLTRSMGDARYQDITTGVPSSRRIDTGSGLSGGGNLQGDRTLTVDGSVVRTSRSVASGAGLINGGDLSADLTIAMGPPSDITRTSLSEATGNTHSHNLTGPNFRDMLANYVNPTTLGGVVFASNSGPTVGFGDTTAGSNLHPSSDGGVSGINLGGTWRCMGNGLSGWSTMWMRVV